MGIGVLVEEASFSLKHCVRESLTDTGPQGCLVLLHGVKENETSLAELALAQHPGMLVVLARGPIEFKPDCFGWFSVKFQNGSPSINFDEAQASRERLVRFLRELAAAYGVPPERTVVAGFSQGGIMSAAVALTQPDSVAGFGLFCGRILPELEPHLAAPHALAGLSAFVAHGEHDGLLPPFWAKRSGDWLTRLGVEHDNLVLPVGHEVTAEMHTPFRNWLSRLLGL